MPITRIVHTESCDDAVYGITADGRVYAGTDPGPLARVRWEPIGELVFPVEVDQPLVVVSATEVVVTSPVVIDAHLPTPLSAS